MAPHHGCDGSVFPLGFLIESDLRQQAYGLAPRLLKALQFDAEWIAIQFAVEFYIEEK